MTIEIHKLQHMRVISETAFGVDQTTPPATFTNFLSVPFLEGTASLSLTQTMLPVTTAQQYLDQIAEDILGPKAWTLSFQMHLAATGTAADASTAAVTSPLGILLKAIMGAQSLSEGTTYASGGAQTGCVVNAGQGTRVTAGNAILFGTEAREIKTRSTDTIAFKQAMAATLAAGTLYRSATYSLIENPAESLQFVIEGTELQDRFVLMGGQGSFSMEFPFGGIPTVTFNISGASWVNFTGSALAVASYTATSQVVCMASELTVPVNGTTTRVAIDAQTVGITPNITYAPIKVLGGVQNILRFRRQRSVPIATAQLGLAYENQDWFTGRSATTAYAINLQIGTTAGSTVLVCLGTNQIVDVQRAEVEPQLAGQNVSFKARNDGDCGTASTELERSALRIHLL